tara:strand:- start:854 stop:1240 length:387 start_codon:yes stop_codon:yes gene_type:complete
MNSIISRGLDFILLSFVTAVLYFIHYNISMEYFLGDKIPLNAIYLFNYFSVLIFLIGSKLNLNYNFINPLTFFILLTLIKMLATILFFILFNNEQSYDINLVVYNFFPVYFLLLSLEVLSLKKSLDNI